MGTPRPLVLVQDRRTVFASFHELAHVGTPATRSLPASRMVWRSMNSNVATWFKDCQACSRGKVTFQYTSPVQPIPVPAGRTSHVHVDIVSPLQAAKDGSSYILTTIDRTTRWLEAAPLQNMGASTCADTFIATLVASFGGPASLTTDRGT